VRVSVAANGIQGGDKKSRYPSISADGRYVAFESDATNLVPGDTNGFSDVFAAPDPLLITH
jgi:Tol biopolymer transport system component